MISSEVIVFIGSFDPVHRGHIEAAEKALERWPTALCVLFLPNNPRKNKPNRSALQVRCHWLSFHMQLYNEFSWIGHCQDEKDKKSEQILVCDTRDCSIVIEQLRTRGHNIIGLIGSDIVKIPKLQADSWIVVQRVCFPFSPIVDKLEQNSVQTKRILATDCRWQHLSSSALRSPETAAKSCGKELHNNLLPFAEKRFSGSTLSSASVSHRTCRTADDRPAYAIEYVDGATAARVVENRNAVALQNHGGIDVANILEWSREGDSSKTVHFELIDGQTVFDLACDYLNDLIHRDLFEKIITDAFFNLQQLLRSENLKFPHTAHGDPSSTNVMVCVDKTNNCGNDAQIRFTLIDFEKLTRIGSREQAIENYTKFARSFSYYMLLRGMEHNRDLLDTIEHCETVALRRNKEKVF